MGAGLTVSAVVKVTVKYVIIIIAVVSTVAWYCKLLPFMCSIGYTSGVAVSVLNNVLH